MAIINESFFKQLEIHRESLANALDDPALRGVKSSVVEKYSDQAHFIYELLQNADDAKATCARFVLEKNKLIFAHNGTRRFSISNPATEEGDSLEGTLGDINAITSIANSNKKEVSIGKFGVGFKSVFQYTTTPHIYGPAICFKIDRFIVPIKLHEDFPERNAEETLFVFPFDHSERGAEVAYEDILSKLHTLDYPLLFLKNLKDISFETPASVGLYGKTISNRQIDENTTIELVCLTQNDNNVLYDEQIWLFTRTDEEGHSYSVGFFIGEDGKLVPKKHSAFCFFPTKEVTELNFIIHAPFLLTDSREGIRAGVAHNKQMIESLANLAEASLTYLIDIGIKNNNPLIDDNLFDIIPYDKKTFNEVDDRNKISFKPFYTKIKEAMANKALIPSIDGYTSSKNAYWAFVPQIAELFSNAQLADLTANEEAKWVFTSFGRQDTRRKNESLTDYIDAITRSWIDENYIINGHRKEGSAGIVGGISKAFIEGQSIEWLHKFYQWISETKGRIRLIKTKPIFLDQNKNAVSAYDANGHIILFLPTDTEGYCMIYNELLENETTAEFIEQLGIELPSLHDEIYTQILPLYENNPSGIDTKPHFIKMLKYYIECPQTQVDGFIDLIKNYKFVESKEHRWMARDLYLPTEQLKKYFETKPETVFIDYDSYDAQIDEKDKKYLDSFLTELGIKKEPGIISQTLAAVEAYEIKPVGKWPYSTRSTEWKDKHIDGCKEIIDSITYEKSILLWDQLLNIIKVKCTGWNTFKNLISGGYSYFYRAPQYQPFESTEMKRLREEPWLFNKNNQLFSAKDLSIGDLSDAYKVSTDEAKQLLQVLNINEPTVSGDDLNLTDEQREKIALAESILDIPLEDVKRFAEEYRTKRKNLIQAPKDEERKSGNQGNEEEILNVVKEISQIAIESNQANRPALTDVEKDEVADEDEYIKPSINFSKKIEQSKERSAKEIADIAYLDELTQRALKFNKYSFGWFKTLLELEAINSAENNANSREISITFSKAEREQNTTRTLILRHPNRYIPQSMEELADIPLELHFKDGQTVKLTIEVVSIKSYTLRVKLRENPIIDEIDFSLVTEAKIQAKNPVFLLEELKKAFNKLDFADDYDMQLNLCKNIEFIFGPPGTGKTTYLSNEVIIPLIEAREQVKILVLTPTNKAADVLVRRIMKSKNDNKTELDWLIRFRSTNDELIEQSGILKDKNYDIKALSKNVTVTTIARFPYDYFMADANTRVNLNGFNWDYIIIDEASMIPLINIIYPLYKKTPEKFIIAGDPFQIEPITTVDMWKNENIYTLVKLKSFANPKTMPHQYEVKSLTTQYRSIPEIGEVFSHFAYEGILAHNRTKEDRKPLHIDGLGELEPLNIIKFPASKYESIYRPKRLQSKSNYQVYSALFAFEFTKYLTSKIKIESGTDIFRIGLIAPYRAQADLIDKLMSSLTLEKNIDVQVGTIHGFQGDECDIIMALFNPPPSISTSKEMFLNKLNIINVSISRARDYLFMIMPDDSTENIENLTAIKKVEGLFKSQLSWSEMESNYIEEIMFDNRTFIEENSFSTTHQLVNVYGKPEKRYEVRSEENAIDIQIYEDTKIETV